MKKLWWPIIPVRREGDETRQFAEGAGRQSFGETNFIYWLRLTKHVHRDTGLRQWEMEPGGGELNMLGEGTYHEFPRVLFPFCSARR